MLIVLKSSAAKDPSDFVKVIKFSCTKLYTENPAVPQAVAAISTKYRFTSQWHRVWINRNRSYLTESV